MFDCAPGIYKHTELKVFLSPARDGRVFHQFIFPAYNLFLKVPDDMYTPHSNAVTTLLTVMLLGRLSGPVSKVTRYGPPSSRAPPRFSNSYWKRKLLNTSIKFTLTMTEFMLTVVFSLQFWNCLQLDESYNFELALWIIYALRLLNYETASCTKRWFLWSVSCEWRNNHLDRRANSLSDTRHRASRMIWELWRHLNARLGSLTKSNYRQLEFSVITRLV